MASASAAGRTLMSNTVPARLFGSTCLAMALCLPAAAQPKDCANEPGGAAMAECLAARYKAADQALNRVYNAALKDLSAAERAKLVEAQRAWLRYRDAGLALMIELNKDTRSYGSLLVGDYKATVTEKRVKELKYIFASPADPPVTW